jgi:selenocysteine lyase/cysteine desulfurase
VAAVEYLREVGWEFVSEHERELGQRFLGIVHTNTADEVDRLLEAL